MVYIQHILFGFILTTQFLNWSEVPYEIYLQRLFLLSAVARDTNHLVSLALMATVEGFEPSEAAPRRFSRPLQ